MTTVFLHHYFVPQKSYGYTYLTNFHEEFDNADHIGIEASKKPFINYLISVKKTAH